MSSLRQGSEDVGSPPAGATTPTPTAEDGLFATFSYNPTSKRLTMIPVKYKLKEERRKVLKISVNKLKKIDDPESWLCRSVLINNTVKKLQKETREEKMNKHLNVVPATYPTNGLSKSADDDFECQLNNNNNNNNNNYNNNNDSKKNNKTNYNVNGNNSFSEERDNGRRNGSGKEREIPVEASSLYPGEDSLESEFFYRKDGFGESEDRRGEKFAGFAASDSIETRTESKASDHPQEKTDSSLSRGVSLSADFVDHIPSIRRCASRKKSLDEDGTARDILDLNASAERTSEPEPEEVDECDVHDVLSQLYMPPTPRMLTAIDGDADDDDEEDDDVDVDADLNVVDIDSPYMDVPEEPTADRLGGCPGKRGRQEVDVDEDSVKRRRPCDAFDCFDACGVIYDSFLRGSSGDAESDGTDPEGVTGAMTQSADEELIELEDEEDIERRLSQSLSSHYHLRAPEKTGGDHHFYEETCDSQYSCGHAVTMFGDLQSVTFHNLIAGLET